MASLFVLGKRFRVSEMKALPKLPVPPVSSIREPVSRCISEIGKPVRRFVECGVRKVVLSGPLL